MFEGPLFIVGRPRSGTKLLRHLLNQHSRLSIPKWETNFIPSYATQDKLLQDLHDKMNLENLIETLSQTVFYRNLTSEEGYPGLTKGLWLSSVTDYSYRGVIETLFKLHASFEGKTIWGDKSPSNMKHLPLLKELFPSAKFIHIIRDVRDVCLSLRNSWRLHPQRGAQQWQDDILQCRHDARHLEKDYLEIRYEALLQEPQAVLRQVCTFLEIHFEPTMATLRQPTRERLGGTQGATQIVGTNFEKWRSEFSPVMIKRIEEISWDVLQSLGYSVLYATHHIPLNSAQACLLRGTDAWHRFTMYCRFEGSVIRAIARKYRERRFG